MNSYRQPTKIEQEILEKLLSKPFQGAKEIKEQLKNFEVRLISEYTDNWGSLEFRINNKVKADVESRVPVQAQTKDSDGVPVDIFLHIIDGLIDELEVTKADNTPLISSINPTELQVTTYEEMKNNNQIG